MIAGRSYMLLARTPIGCQCRKREQHSDDGKGSAALKIPQNGDEEKSSNTGWNLDPALTIGAKNGNSANDRANIPPSAQRTRLQRS